MSDLVNLLVPTDERFRGIGPDLAGKFCLAQGGSEADAAALTDAVTRAFDEVSAPAGAAASVALTFRVPDGHVEVALQCDDRQSVVSHPLPSARSAT